MSPSTPRQPSPHDAARADTPPTPAAARPLPEFQPHTPSPYSPIEREIERSQRASAALAATRALARASFTDSQLAAEDSPARDGADDDFDASGWARTEHVAFDPTPQTDESRAPTPRNLVGGTFNPGIASQQGRLFPGASIAQSPIRTRSGATARFAQESRHAPRGEGAAPAPAAPSHSPPAIHYEKPAVIPMLAPPSKTVAAAKARAPARTGTGEPAKMLLAAALGAAIVLAGGGLAWNAGLLSRGPNDVALVTPAVAAQAEAARVLSQERDIAIAPAAGLPSQRSDAEVDAALAAAARAAAVPAESVRAAAPASVAVAARASAPRHVESRPSAEVDEAVANARARADRFLASPSAVTPAAPTQATPAP